jgi:ribonuclease R
MAQLTDQILHALGRPSYIPVKPKVLAKRLNIGNDDYPEFRKTLRALVHEGRVQVNKDSTLRAADPHGSVVGLFRRTTSGASFVRAHTSAPEKAGDIRIREGKELDASNGDEVLVRLTRKSSKTAAASGEVVRILARATRTFVGTYFERDGQAFVRVDGTVFAHSILVGDPGAKGAKSQDKVVIDVIRFPTNEERGEGVITQVLGALGEPGVDLQSIIHAYGLPTEFPPKVLAEAGLQAEKFREDDLDGRTDFTEDVVITIDPVDARDFDDAISLTVDPKTKHWILTVHIADVAHFAPAGSALDQEAKQRSTSVYLPQCVIPMFPEIISNGLASLQEGKRRYVKSARMEFTPGLQKGHVEFFNGVIKTRKRFSYEQVQALLDGMDAKESPPESLDPEVYKLLRRMRDLALLLRKKRFKRGSLELSMPEAVLEYDDKGQVNGAHFAEHNMSHQMIEEFMLAANEAVAEHFSHLEVPFLRRVHPAPKPEKLEQFGDFAELLGYPLERPQDRFELQKLLNDTAEKPERAAIHFALLRSLKQAAYSPIQDEHFALASRDYCHFTSPIRRYPDLTVHRTLDMWIKTGKASANSEELVVLGDHCSKMERRAQNAEREMVKLKLLQYLSRRLGEKLDAVITGVAEYGFFAQAEQFPAEGLVHVASLRNDFFRFEEEQQALFGSRTGVRYRLGDRVRVEVARVDLQKRMLDFRLTADQPSNEERPQPRKPRKPPKLVRKNKKRRK